MEKFPLYAPIVPFLDNFDLANLLATNKTMHNWVEKKHHLTTDVLKARASTCNKCGQPPREDEPEFYKTPAAFHKKYPISSYHRNVSRFRFFCAKCCTWICWHCESSVSTDRCCFLCRFCTKEGERLILCRCCQREFCPLHPELMGSKDIRCNRCQAQRTKEEEEEKNQRALLERKVQQKRKRTENKNTSNTSAPSSLITREYVKKTKRQKLK